MAVAEKVREAAAGETVKHIGDEVTVAESCGGPAGYWYCSTHDEGFNANWMVNSHADDGKRHLLFWVCAIHGPEAAR